VEDGSNGVPLHHAASIADMAMLLELEPSMLNFPATTGMTALHWCIMLKPTSA
jgi:hypothetical protein